MYPSAALCRVQETLQRERAAGTTLANVRQVAERAASAWEAEALSAEQREQRQVHTSLVAADTLKNKQIARESLDKTLSENPDRGLAHA